MRGRAYAVVVSGRLLGVRGYGVALVAVAVTTGVIGILLSAFPVGQLSIVYLVPVLAAATRLGRGPAVAASFAAFLLYDFFFTAPFHQLSIRDPDEWISLGLFLVTAIATSELAANERRRAMQAMQREREALLLFDALRLMGDPDLDRALAALAERVRAELALRAVAIEMTIAGKRHEARAGDAEPGSPPAEVLGGGRPPTASVAGGPPRWIRVVPPRPGVPFGMRGRLRRSEIAIKSGERDVGRLALIRDEATVLRPADTRVLALIAASIGSVAERAELREATTRSEVLRRTDELRSAMLAAVSHDLRTPLASIIASAGSLRQVDVQWTDPERAQFLADIESEARRLSRIVDNLLDLSRIEAGALRPDRGWYDVSALVDDVVGRLRGVTREHAVNVDVPEDLPPVFLDYVEIDQVLTNLIENAARHTGPRTPIDVRARIVGNELVIEVSDAGPGIDARLAERLFHPFVRGASGRHAPPGTGLGLAVARGLVEAHGGSIAVAQRAGGGAVFRVTLPVGTREEAPIS